MRGQRIDITNSASDSAGKPYPLILERRGHYAEDTLRRDLSQWANAALDEVAPERTGESSTKSHPDPRARQGVGTPV